MGNLAAFLNITTKVLNLKTLLSSSRFPIGEIVRFCLRDIEDVSQANLTIFKYKVLNFVSLKLGKF